LAKTDDDAIAFPTGKFEDFYLNGLGGAKDPRVALRDKLILLLVHGAGFRRSEALLLWVTDVFEDPSDSGRAIVRIYNEVEGAAPEGWKTRRGIKTRKAYLQEKYHVRHGRRCKTPSISAGSLRWPIIKTAIWRRISSHKSLRESSCLYGDSI